MRRGPPRWVLALLALGASTSLGMRPAAAEPQPGAERDDNNASDWTVDPEGRTFRVGFDPGSRWLVGSGLSPYWSDEAGGAVRGQVETGVLYRHIVDLAGEGVSFKLYHQAVRSRVWFDGRGATRLSSTLYAMRFLRWSQDGRIVLPTTPPQRINFPLNIGLEAAVGAVEYAELSPSYGLEIGVIRAEVLLDPWRRRELGSYAQFGLGPAYDIRPHGRDDVVVDHVVSPFTQASFAVHHESADGRHVVHSRVHGGYVLSSEHGSGGRFGALASYEAIVLAINDVPLSGYAEAGYRYESLPRPTGSDHELQATLGVRLGVPMIW